jgi:hypothetical protein
MIAVAMRINEAQRVPGVGRGSVFIGILGYLVNAIDSK